MVVSLDHGWPIDLSNTSKEDSSRADSHACLSYKTLPYIYPPMFYVLTKILYASNNGGCLYVGTKSKINVAGTRLNSSFCFDTKVVIK